MPTETIADILSEIVVQKYQTSFSASDVIAWRDRIEAAAKRENEREADCTNCDYANVVAENERLRAALAPVLECATPDNIGWKEVWNYSDAVREAQRIASGGVANNEAR